MHYENGKNFEEKKVLIHISPFAKEAPTLQLRKMPST